MMVSLTDLTQSNQSKYSEYLDSSEVGGCETMRMSNTLVEHTWTLIKQSGIDDKAYGK